MPTERLITFEGSGEETRHHRGRVRYHLDDEDGDWDMLLSSLEEDEGTVTSPHCGGEKTDSPGETEEKGNRQFPGVSPTFSHACSVENPGYAHSGIFPLGIMDGVSHSSPPLYSKVIICSSVK